MLLAYSLLFSFTVQAVGNALSMGIIWYGKNLPEVQRTLIKRLESNNCVLSILFSTVGLTAVVFMEIFGGLNILLCDFLATHINVVLCCYFLNANVIITLRKDTITGHSL